VTPESSRRLGAPKPAPVDADEHGVPVAVGAAQVDSVREEWVVEDRWWTPRPLRRRYFEVVLANGRNVVVFRDLVEGGWFSQRA
jgi:CO dehydrogenase/acetyl-CoA synthase delta subunit